MYGPNRYLRWVLNWYGKVDFDLAMSGLSTATIAELGMPPSLEDPTAWERLRAGVARYNGVPTTEAIPALGTSHGVWATYAALLAPGDEIVLEDPAYEPLWRIAEGMGVGVVRFARPPAERFALDPARVAAAMTPRTRLVVISNLHNPGGVRASDDTIREVARIAASHGAHLLVDEVYAPFDDLVAPGGVWPGSARRLAPNVVVAASLTKAYGLGPHRIGWVLGPSAFIERAADAIVSNLGHSPLPYANIGVHAFDRIEWLAERSRANVRGKREQVAAWVATRPDLAWSAPDSGLFGFATRTTSDRDLTPAIEQGARDHGVIVAAGAFFGVPNGFRLAWSIDRAKLTEALVRLGRAIPTA
jgi:aspartate/methionine/tyrosine aminotransferase